MNKIESFKSFSQLQSQLREEAAQKELAAKREASVEEYNELLSKYNVAKITELSEEDRATFMQELGEGNAFTGALKKAKEDGDDEFTVGDETYKVEEETEGVNENKYAEAGKLGYNDQFLNRRQSLSKTLSLDLGLNPKHEFGGGDWLGFDYVSLYTTGGKKGGTILADALTGKYTYDELKSAAADYLGVKESEEVEEQWTVEEGRAFVAAARKAKDAGEKEFEYNGKKYPVLIERTEEVNEAKGNKREVTSVVKSYSTYAQKFPILNDMNDTSFLWMIREVLKAALIDANFHTEAAMVGKYITPAKLDAIEINPEQLGGSHFIKVPKKTLMDLVDVMAGNVTGAAKYDGYAIIEGTAEYLDTIRAGKKSAEGLRAALAALMA